jgi:hypothetical protein
VNTSTGMISYQNATEVAEMAKLLASGGIMLPQHLRGSAGACALTLMQAIKWRLDFAFVASMQYVEPKSQRVSYMSQLFRAVMENSGLITGRMRHEYIGEGMERRCKVYATFKGESEPHDHISPPLKDLLPAKNEEGVYRGSPLWKRKPDVQMLYDTQRDWVRIHAPDIFGGIYDPDEFDENEGASAMKTVNPPQQSETSASLMERLRKSRQEAAESERRGFNIDNVEREIDGVNGGEKPKRGRVIENEPTEHHTLVADDLIVDPPTDVHPPTEAALDAARSRGAEDGAGKVRTPLDFDLRAPGREAEWEAYQQSYIDHFPEEEKTT